MEKTKVLYVQQEIKPYLKESQMSKTGRYLPQGILEKRKEIRTFMPRFGNINERRNQLHEVIRLSGMNLIIDDTDHPLIIKVASIQAARMQIYFIDNEEFFQRKFLFKDKNNKFFDDNDERAIFFTRGVIETVKKLGWPPNIVHCSGWFTSLVPLFLKRVYHENPLFSESKIVLSIYDDEFEEKLNEKLIHKINYETVNEEDKKKYKSPDYISMYKAAIDYSDGIIFGSEKINPELKKYAENSGKPLLPFQNEEEYIDAYNNFYDEISVKEAVLS